MITEALILAWNKQSLRTIVETDLSNYVNSGVFFQIGKDRLLHLIPYLFKNLNPIEYNY